MAKKKTPPATMEFDLAHLVDDVRARLAENRRVRRELPGWGRIHVDRQLPFLCVYRRPVVGSDEGTNRLVTTEAAYLTASGIRKFQRDVFAVIGGVAETMAERFGAFLLLEVWASSTTSEVAKLPAGERAMQFRIHLRSDGRLDRVANALEHSLRKMRVARMKSRVEIRRSARPGPAGMRSLQSVAENDPRIRVLGLEVRPIYRNASEARVYPLVLREFRRGLTRAFRPALFEFVQSATTSRPKHFHVLGRRAVVKAVRTVDRQLADVAESFDFLLQVTPINGEEAWRQFRRDHFDQTPAAHYRPIPVVPVVLKRKLYQAPVERVEDPALFMLLRQKQDELDRQITMLLDRNTNRFLHGSLQVYGGVDDALKRLAEKIMERLPPRTRDDSRGGYLDCKSFAQKAESQIEAYREQLPDMDAAVQIRSDIGRSLMVNNGSLLIGEQMQIPANRADALLAHEVGTHVLTYYKGRSQPFHQLRVGLAGYEALQEGLAVLAEYLVGGLSRPRLRLLAARVLTTWDMIDGAAFVEAFRRLYHNYGFEQRTAFTIVRRIFRGGGLTKDAVYLRGLDEVLGYLGKGGELQPLFIGKAALSDMPIVRELQFRGVLEPAPLTPLFLSDPQALARLASLGQRKNVFDLIETDRE